MAAKTRKKAAPPQQRGGSASEPPDTPADLYVMGYDFTWALDERRLNRIEWMLRTGQPIDERTASELVHTLRMLRDFIPIMQKPPKLRTGPKPDHWMRVAIGAVHVLHTEYGIDIRVAVRGIIWNDDGHGEEALAKMRENVEKAYRRAIKAGDYLFGNHKIVLESLARIKKSQGT